MHQTMVKAHQEPLVVEFKQEAPPIKIVSYHHPLHLTRQQSFKKDGGHQQPSGPRWK